ncbi:hypothetical protein K0C01_08065 [Salinarchaeum sp. IM2453]|uniref:hypothetical protein n=1 Tax=Salinarchaeum sp. IM2453 TaxID=2862870 RepID=UPI001C83F228|nr:hypothetical protein [Salinarchaeum sp. IM2453]QZA87759.1 hypothetical protein K0C01_08065 [Salinarchaeum sp. IM2453]
MTERLLVPYLADLLSPSTGRFSQEEASQLMGKVNIAAAKTAQNYEAITDGLLLTILKSEDVQTYLSEAVPTPDEEAELNEPISQDETPGDDLPKVTHRDAFISDRIDRREIDRFDEVLTDALKDVFDTSRETDAEEIVDAFIRQLRVELIEDPGAWRMFKERHQEYDLIDVETAQNSVQESMHQELTEYRQKGDQIDRYIERQRAFIIQLLRTVYEEFQDLREDYEETKTKNERLNSQVGRQRTYLIGALILVVVIAIAAVVGTIAFG